MALKVPRAGGPSLFKEGYSFHQGIEEAVIR
jgi:T-complex protein 1 subunit theta